MSGTGSRYAGKLLRLREWLTVLEAARHLSTLFEEPVGEPDVLRLALDGHLTLSVNFVNHSQGRCGSLVSCKDAKRFEIPLDASDLSRLGIPGAEAGMFSDPQGLSLGDSCVFEPAEEVVTIDGIWDLTMIGAERLDVEHRYQSLTRGPAVDLVCLDGVLLCRPDGTYCQLQAHYEDNEFYNPEKLKLTTPWNHPRNFYPAGGLPSDAVFVVRTSALQRLASTLSGPYPGADKPLERRERTTLLVIIAGLAKLAKLDLTKASSAATAIEHQTALMGARVAARTIEGHLKRIGEALDSRG